MAGAGPMAVDQFSERTRLRLRYAQEWLNAQAASGFVDYDPDAQSYKLSPKRPRCWRTTPARPSWAGVRMPDVDVFQH
ncbi:hypothetical protein [Variovorax sp. YR216]|uniref:hypothetical protein n=1 Tax=Variovorax sp. YR216 TaxID=1882828 RepID=UPI003525BDC8